MDYTTQISDLRLKREELINGYRKENGQDVEHFDYFPMDEYWHIPGVISLRIRKE